MDDITIVVDLNNQGVNNLKHLQSLQYVDQVNFVFITDKKRYELPIEINELNGKVKKEKTGLDGIVFHVCGTETLHESAIAYIKNFYQHNNTNVEIPYSIRSIFVQENANGVEKKETIASHLLEDEEKHFLELLSVEPEDNKKIKLTFAHHLPLGLEYQIRAVADKGKVLKCTLISNEMGIETISFIVEEPIPLALYRVGPKGEAEKMPYSCSWTSKGVEWLKCSGDKLLYGGKDNIINIELFALSKLQELLLAIIKKYYFAVEYDSDIKVIRAYLRSRETGATGSLVLINGETSKDTLDNIKKENSEAKIYHIAQNATEYGSHDHKLYSLLAEKVYIPDNKKATMSLSEGSITELCPVERQQSPSNENNNYQFPFDAVNMQEFNSLYQGIISSKVIIDSRIESRIKTDL